MSWIDCVVNNNYQIFTTYPFQLRKKSNGKIIKEWHDYKGYVKCKLNGKPYFKHRIIANQFIPNINNLPFIDHINRDRSDNRIENLRYVSNATNSLNKTSQNGIIYDYIKELPDDSIIVDKYNQHTFENYYYSPSLDRFIFYTGIEYRLLPIHKYKTGGHLVMMHSTNDKIVKIYYSTFIPKINSFIQ